MANYIQGNLKEKYHVYEYTGLETDTARVEVDNKEQTIAVDVLFDTEDAEKLLKEVEEIVERFDNLSSTATIDANVGTPEVDVDLQVVDDSYNIKFDFKNLKGEPGNISYATFEVDPATGMLIMNYGESYTGAEFSINDNGYLEVTV